MNKKNENEYTFVDFSQRFRLIRKIKDPYGRQFQITKDMKTQKRSIVKSYIIQSPQQEKEILQNLSNYVQLRQIQSLAKFICFTKIQNKEIQASFQYHDMTLQQFIKTKNLDKQKMYQICTCLLNQMIILLAIMQQIGMEIDDIRKTNILIQTIQQKKYQFKLFFDQRQKNQLKSFFSVYLSPQRLQQYQRQQQNLYQSQPKLVYQLALLVLDIATEEIRQSFYNQSKINNKTIQRKLLCLNKKYTKKYLSNILYQMLKPLNDRLRINDIKTKNQFQFGKTRSFSVNKTHMIQSYSDSNDNIKKQNTINNANPKKIDVTQNLNLPKIYQNRNSNQGININQYQFLNNSRKSYENSGTSQSLIQNEKLITEPHPEIIKSLEKMKERLNQVRSQTKQYQDGSIYNGQMREGLRQGLGIYSYNHGDVYFGEWKQNNLINGTYIFKNGESYQGTVKNGKQGFGKYRYANGNIYQGSWQNDLKHGKGQMKYPNGDRYQGNWERGKKNGHGIYIYPNGIIYQGNFLDGKKNGYGKISFPDKSKFEGNWDKFYVEGFGKIFYENGDVFQGNFHESFKNGKGVYKWKDGTLFDGDFREDQINGFCKINYENGDYYEGNLIGEMKNGEGTYIYSNKDIFKGIWKNNLKQMGKYSFSDGNIFQGEFADNQIFFGKMYYQNGDIYEGQFKNNQRNGYGKYRFVDNTLISGQWKNDNFVKYT